MPSVLGIVLPENLFERLPDPPKLNSFIMPSPIST